uniref:Putative Aminomethyltransferase n=1 Tax=Ectopseudomonas oleovorans TaxID=301 RepID=A0A653BD35_ECTOL
MANSWRISALAERHRALGSQLEDWSGMGTAWTYASDLADEHEAIRTRAGLMDVSGLKKVHYVGPHAESLLEYATSRDISKVYPGKSVYATMLNEAGKFVDDCVIYRTGPNAFMVVHGSGNGHEMLLRSAQGRQVAVLFDDDLHDLSLQGPLAVDFLAEQVPGIRELPYFHHLQTRLFDRPVMISRTGYTGERGYEIFCKAADAPLIWDSILDKGRDLGIIPVPSPRWTGCGWRATCCSSPTTTRRCIPSPTSRPATPCGSWGWTSPCRRPRGISVAPASIGACRARSASGSSVCCSTATRRPRPATRCGPGASRSG